MKFHRGQAVATLAIAIIVIAVAGMLTFGYWNRYIHGNKTFIDMKQNFRYAYLKTDNGSEKIEITTWKDWQNSDAIQFVDVNGKVYYTHLNNVILSDK